MHQTLSAVAMLAFPATFGVGLVTGNLCDTWWLWALPAADGARGWLCQTTCLVLVQAGGILVKGKQASSQQAVSVSEPYGEVGNIITPMGPLLADVIIQTHLAWSPIYLIENFSTTPHPHHGKHTLSTTPHLPDGNIHLVPHPIYLMEHTLVPTPSQPHWKCTLDTTPHLPDGNTHLVPHPIYLMGTHTWHPTPAYDDVCYPKFGHKGFSSSDGIIQTPTNWNLEWSTSKPCLVAKEY